MIGRIAAALNSTAPEGWLLCDGSTFDESQYPELYTFLGSNILPDLRECTIAMAGTQTKTTFAAHENGVNGSYGDAVMQSHTHTVSSNTGVWGNTTASYNFPNTSLTSTGLSSTSTASFSSSATGSGSLFRDASLGVNYFIKVV